MWLPLLVLLLVGVVSERRRQRRQIREGWLAWQERLAGHGGRFEVELGEGEGGRGQGTRRQRVGRAQHWVITGFFLKGK